MAVIATNTLTLADWAKRLDPDTNAVTPAIVELLGQTNEILTDMMWKEGNLSTGHRLTMRTGLPAVAWRRLNEGIAKSKSTTAQVDEACGMMEAICEVDKDLADLNGNTAAFRLSENKAFIEAMNIEMARSLFYGNSNLDPEQILGLAPRYSTISGATNGQNILNGGGTGSTNASIYLVGWGEEGAYGIFPKGTKAGLQHDPGQGYEWAFDASNRRFKAYIDHYQWKCGLALADWRYVVRIANLSVNALVTNTSPAAIIDFMSRAIDRLPKTSGGIKPVFYMNRTIYSFLKLQAMNRSQNALSLKEANKQFELSFLDIPIRKCDQLLNTETQIT